MVASFEPPYIILVKMGPFLASYNLKGIEIS